METKTNTCECDDCFMMELHSDPGYIAWLAEREQDFLDYMEAMTDDRILSRL